MANGAPDPILRTPGGTPFKVGLDIITQGFGAAGVQDSVRRLISATRRLNDPGPLGRVIARRIVSSQKKNILEQRSPSGTPWTPLAHSRGPGRNPGTLALFDKGRLFEAITYRELGRGLYAIGTFDVPYAGFMQDGTRAHIIRAKTSKRLKFWGGSGWVFRREVHHPGTVARPFIGIRPDDVPSIQQLAAAFASAAFDGRAAA